MEADYRRRRLAGIIVEHKGEPISTSQLVEEFAIRYCLDFDALEGDARKTELEALRSQLRRETFDAKHEDAKDFKDRYRDGYRQQTKWTHKDAMSS